MSSSEASSSQDHPADGAAEIRALFQRFQAHPDARAVPDDDVQRLLGAAVRVYAARLETNPALPPFAAGDPVTPTAVLMTVTRMLAAMNVELFELAMWKAWAAS
jgi:hypothetical protein